MKYLAEKAPAFASNDRRASSSCALELDVSQLHAMASTTVAPLAFAARLAGTRLDSRRPRVVRARVPAKSRLVTESVLKVDDSLNEDAPEDSKSPAVLAAAAVATAIVLAASPAHGAEARPAVDVGAHDYYLETMEASGLRPASIEAIEAKSAPATGLNRFGSAATAADETASLVSTAFAVGLAAVLGVSGNNRKGPGASGGKRPGWKKSNNARVATPKSNIVKTSAFGKKPIRKTAGTAYVPSYKGFVGSSSSSRGGLGSGSGSGAGSDGAGSGPAPAMRAAAALGATVVLGGLSTAGPAVLEAEGAAVAAAATSAVLLGTAASAATQTKKKTDVRSNIITFKTAVAPATKTHTKVITRTAPPARKAPPAKPPGGGAKKTKPRWSSGDAPKDTAAWKPAAALLAVVGLGALLLAGSTTTADGPSRKSASSAKRPSGAKPSAAAPRRAGGFEAPTFEAPAVELPAIPAMDFNKGVFESFESFKVPEMKVSLPALDPETPAATLAGAAALLSAAAALARVGLGKLGSLRGAGPAKYDPAAVARSVADAQVWIDAWQRSILFPENPEHVFSSAWDRNAPTPEKAAEASTYAAEAAQSRRPRPFSRADVARRTGDAQAWIDAWAAKTHARSEKALRGWETGRIIGAWNKGLAELDSAELDASAPEPFSEPRSAVATRVKQAQTWINAWQKTLKASATRKKATVKKTKNTTTEQTKTKTTKTKKKGSRRAYYVTIAGVKYDKAALEACRGFAARDGAVDLAAAKSTWALIADGAVKKQTRADGRVVKSSVTNVELATALYVLETFAWADDAQAWFREQVEGVDAK